MLVANEGSAHMAAFRIDEETGGLSEARQYGLDLNPICIKFFET
jgi:6-phosphogluconolactonase (cycloisomerase 2 family)